MIRPDFDPSRVRKCELVVVDGEQMIQFIATGDRHKLMRTDSGELEVIKLPEQGKDYRYGDPYSLDDALDILAKEAHENHARIAEQLKAHFAQQDNLN